MMKRQSLLCEDPVLYRKKRIWAGWCGTRQDLSCFQMFVMLYFDFLQGEGYIENGGQRNNKDVKLNSFYLVQL